MSGGGGRIIIVYGCIQRVCQGATPNFFLFFRVEFYNYLIFLVIFPGK
jgi:hypothetical protein